MQKVCQLKKIASPVQELCGTNVLEVGKPVSGLWGLAKALDCPKMLLPIIWQGFYTKLSHNENPKKAAILIYLVGIFNEY